MEECRGWSESVSTSEKLVLHCLGPPPGIASVVWHDFWAIASRPDKGRERLFCPKGGIIMGKLGARLSNNDPTSSCGMCILEPQSSGQDGTEPELYLTFCLIPSRRQNWLFRRPRTTSCDANPISVNLLILVKDNLVAWRAWLGENWNTKGFKYLVLSPWWAPLLPFSAILNPFKSPHNEKIIDRLSISDQSYFDCILTDNSMK